MNCTRQSGGFFGLAIAVLCIPLWGQGVIATVAGASKIFPSGPAAALGTAVIPGGLALAPNGDVYFSDLAANQVLKLSQGSVTLVAGNGIAGFSGDGGPAVMAALAGPTGVAVDSKGNLLIADENNHRVRRVASDGTITTVAGNGVGAFSGDGGPAVSASMAFPSSIASDAAGNIFISDLGNRKIRKVSAAGIITTFAGTGASASTGDGGLAINAAFIFPQEIFLDTRGNLLVADPADGSIRRIDSSSIITTLAGIHQFGFAGDGGPANKATLALPRGLSTDSAGNVYFADLGSNRVRRIDVNGTITTVVGSGVSMFSGDGGAGSAAGLAAPDATVVDASGRLYIADTDNHRIRQVNAAGVINTIAGNGQADALRDGGPSRSATVSSPRNIAFDAGGNLYVADYGNQRVRRLKTDGTISTVAGNGSIGYSGDGGQAASASFANPISVAVNAAGELFIADRDNHRIRRVSSGVVTTVVGTGVGGFAGDGASAASAQIAYPAGVAVDAKGNLYIGDNGNNRIRVVNPAGVISTFAGTGQAGFSGDGAKGTQAMLKSPTAVSVDPVGNVYIADTGNQRIRKIDTNGIITTVAGNGTTGYGGVGGPALSASLNSPVAVAADGAGNIYIPDGPSSRVLRVDSSGKITLFAGIGESGFAGDGGPAVSAKIQNPAGVALDSIGNVYFSDRDNNRIREVLVASPSFMPSTSVLSFAATAGGMAPPAQSVAVTSQMNTPGLASAATPGLPFSVQTSAPWLSASPASGGLATSLQVTADPSQLGAGSYTGSVAITAPYANPPVKTIAVNFNLSSPITGILAVGSQTLSFSLTQGASSATAQLTITDVGSNPLQFAASASTSTGGNWLQISPSSGSVGPATPATVIVTAVPGTLAVGTYSGTINVTSPTTGQSFAVAVTLTVSAPPQKIILSQTGLTFVAVAQGGSVLPQSIGILNGGAGVMNWTATATTLSGSGWLGLGTNHGTVQRPFLDVSFMDVTVNAQGLAAGNYYGQIAVSVGGASNSPQTVMVVLNVLPPGSNPGPDVRPTGLIFTAVEGASNPGSQNISVANVTSSALDFGLSVGYLSPGSWIKSQPGNGTIQPQSPAQLVVQPDFTGLSAGIRRAGIQLIFEDGTIRTVGILSVVAPASAAGGANTSEGVEGSPKRFAGGCSPTALYPQFTQLGGGSSFPTGWPISIVAKVVDDCGSPVTEGSVVAQFSNGDSPLSLVSLQDGTWSATWQPNTPSSIGVTVSLAAQLANSNVKGTISSTISLQGSQALPVVSAGPKSAAGLVEGPVSPSELVLISGSSLADTRATSGTAPQLSLGGASVIIGGLTSSLLYADGGQILALVPKDLPVDTPQQILVQRDASLAVPRPVIVAAAHPAIFSNDGSGKGQGLIYKMTGGAASVLADSSNPAAPGDTLLIYCTGLGAVDSQGVTTKPASVSIGSINAVVSYAGIAIPGNFPPSGAPSIMGGLVSTGWGGLYQIQITVPNGLSPGPMPLTITVAGQSSPSGVSFVVAGNGASSPVITSVNTAGGYPDIAQNAFIEIKGSNLAPFNVGTGMTWDSAPEFASGRMPTQLSGVSVTVNGKPAFVYFVSPAQLNVLAPLDGTMGQVTIVVTTGGVNSAPFTVTERGAAPSFLRFEATSYVVATHVDYTLLGPASLSSGSYQFTPARPGETITLYAVGFGLPTTPLTNGSSSQSGRLPNNPSIQIGGAPATVTFAGLISPGLYQINLIVPSTASSGDNSITATFNSLVTPSGDLLSVQR